MLTGPNGFGLPVHNRTYSFHGRQLGIENPTGFTRKAPIEVCNKYVPVGDEKQRAAHALEKGHRWLKEHPSLDT